MPARFRSERGLASATSCDGVCVGVNVDACVDFVNVPFYFSAIICRPRLTHGRLDLSFDDLAWMPSNNYSSDIRWETTINGHKQGKQKEPGSERELEEQPISMHLLLIYSFPFDYHSISVSTYSYVLSLLLNHKLSA